MPQVEAPDQQREEPVMSDEVKILDDQEQPDSEEDEPLNFDSAGQLSHKLPFPPQQ